MEIKGVTATAYTAMAATISAGSSRVAKEQTTEKEQNPVMDYITVTQQARERVQESRKTIYDANWIREQIESSKSQTEAMKKEFDKQAKCQLIAARILAGDRVPPEDMRYLAEHDIKTYQIAISMRRYNPDPKEWDQISEDEEERSATGQESAAAIGGGASAVQPECSEVPTIE